MITDASCSTKKLLNITHQIPFSNKVVKSKKLQLFGNVDYRDIWTDGINVYYSYKENCAILTKDGWDKSIKFNISFYGRHVWTDGTYIYYDMGKEHYVWNKGTKSWDEYSCNTDEIDGQDIWTDGTSIYYGAVRQFIRKGVWGELDAVIKNPPGYSATSDYPRFKYVWTDGTDIYTICVDGRYMFVLDKANKQWVKTDKFNTVKNDLGADRYIWSGPYIWTDGTNIYCNRSDNRYYVLNKETSTWKEHSWEGKSNWEQFCCYNDGTNLYVGDSIILPLSAKTYMNCDGVWAEIGSLDNEDEEDESKSANMNVAFGDTAPDDTSKLWIKTAAPESLEARLSFDFVGNEQMQAATLSLPAHVYAASASAVGKKIYIFGGGTSYSKAIYVYDTEANRFEKLSVTLPKEATGNASAAVGKMIYIFGGRSEGGSLGKSKAIYSFDTETQAVQTLTATLPADRTNMAAAAVGSKIYLFGGTYYSNGDKHSSTIYMFNAETEAITSLSARLPANTYYACAVAVGSKIYVFGGHNGSDALNTIRVFDTDTQTLETLDVTLPNPVYMFSGAAVGSAIYLFGGHTGIEGLDTIVRFNAETNEVETLGATIPKKNWSTPAASIGSRIYYFDGLSSSASDHTLNTFVVNIDLPENHMLIETSGAGNTVRLFPNMEIGVKNVYLGNADGKGERVPAALYKDGAWVEI